MGYFAGLDVSVKETSVCIVDDAGRIVREVRVASEPEALLQVLANNTYRFKRIGLEAGPLSQWLYSVLAEAGLPVICVETRHMRAVLKAQINKTDRNDAGGALSTGACEDATQPETAVAADPSQAASIEGHCHRERPACHLAQLRPQGGYGGDGQVRGTHQGACRKPSRFGRAGGTIAHCPTGRSRAARHPTSPRAGRRPRR